jgi:acyl carrier protein
MNAEMNAETTATTVARVKLVIAEVCAIEPATVHEEGFLLGYDIDSLRTVELIMALEQAFELELSEQDPRLRTVQTVRDLAAFVDGVRAGAVG